MKQSLSSYSSPFSPEIEAIMQDVETERRAREEVERLAAFLELIKAEPLTEEETEQYRQRIYAWIDMQQRRKMPR